MTDPAAPPPMPAPAPGTPQAAPPGTDYPGKTLGIVGLILVFFTSVIGLIISAVALSQSKKAGYKNTPALVGVILGIISAVIGIIIAIVAIVGVVGLAQPVRRARRWRARGERRHDHLRQPAELI